MADKRVSETPVDSQDVARFQAQIRIGGAKIYLGSFATIEAASAVAQAAKAGASLEVPRGDD